jgi:hypothetical protein
MWIGSRLALAAHETLERCIVDLVLLHACRDGAAHLLGVFLGVLTACHPPFRAMNDLVIVSAGAHAATELLAHLSPQPFRPTLSVGHISNFKFETSNNLYHLKTNLHTVSWPMCLRCLVVWQIV